MKKIMFNDRLLLTDAVLSGEKTMTRRLVGNRMTKDDIEAYEKGFTEVAWYAGQYKAGEIVAIAQPYKNIADSRYFKEQCAANEQSVKMMEWEPGWYNKMFAAAYYMPHQIRIESLKVERLQDIRDEDIIEEGIKKGMYLEPENVLYYFDEFCGFFRDGQVRMKGYSYKTAREAFAVLIDKVCGKGTWEQNPYVFAYTFKLIK